MCSFLRTADPIVHKVRFIDCDAFERWSFHVARKILKDNDNTAADVHFSLTVFLGAPPYTAPRFSSSCAIPLPTHKHEHTYTLGSRPLVEGNLLIH